MITREDILELETRREIFNLILKYPGLHLRELSRRTDLSLSGLRHHLNYLIKQEYVVTKSDQRYTRYYASKEVGRRDQIWLNILRQEVPRKIVLLLITAGPAELYNKNIKDKKTKLPLQIITHSKKDLTNLTKYWDKKYADIFHLEKSRVTIDFHLKKLINAEIVEKIQVGRVNKYRIKDEFGIWLFLAKYQKAFSDNLVNLRLSWHDAFIEKRIQAALDAAWDVFPHPYYA